MGSIPSQPVLQILPRRYRNRNTLICRYQTKYPESAEREYQREAAAVLKMVYRIVLQSLSDMGETEIRTDAKDEEKKPHPDFIFGKAMEQAFSLMERELMERFNSNELRSKLKSLASLTCGLTIREWKKAVHSTLGINLLEDYYRGDFFKKMLREWIEQNTSFIVNLPHSTMGEMKRILKAGFLEGKPVRSVSQEIQHAYTMSKRHAQFFARDQIAKLNGQIAKVQQLDAGIQEYVWSTSKDRRVRTAHKRLEGKRFRWDHPPDVGNGRHCHPGEDFQCRCIALPVFDLKEVHLPWEAKQ